MSIRLAGVLGSPIGHSKSPLIQNHWLKTLKINGLYAPIDVASEDFSAWLEMAGRLGFVGFNVTIPHKEAAADHAAELSKTARRAGSVNTLHYREDGALFGDSTDGYGFLRNLEERAGWRSQGARIAMLGAGGAARAVAAALLDGGARELRLTNRSAARAEQLAEVLGGPIELCEWPASDAFFSDADLIVNATSLGMADGPHWIWRLPPLSSAVLATDLIYKPLKTPFLAAAEQQGARVVDGLGMLLHQAVPGFERWFGKRPEVTEELRRMVLSTEGALP